MRISLRPLASIFSLFSCVLGLGACGGSDDSGATGTTDTAGGSAGQSGAAGKANTAGGAGTAGKAGAGGGGGSTAGRAGASGGNTAGSSGAGASGKGGAAGLGGSGGTGGVAGVGGAAGKGGAAGGGNAGGGQAGGGQAGGGQAGGGQSGSGQGGQGAAGTGGKAGMGGSGGAGGSPACAPDCEGLCVKGECCDPLQACGEVCCGGTLVCSFNKCVAPGASCLDPSDCDASEYCEPLLGDGNQGMGGQCTMGLKGGKCLPKPPSCAPGAPPDPTGNCVTTCESKKGGQITPVLKYSWGGVTTPPYDTDVMMTPIVIQLDDDDCDGKITARDTPELAFIVYANQLYFSKASLVVTSIKQGKLTEIWRAQDAVYMDTQLAGGDIDGAPGNEIVACGIDGSVTAFAGLTGQVLWTSPDVLCAVPAIADLDHDGQPEIIVEGGILDGKTGALKAKFTPAMEGSFAVSDLDGDGQLDIVSSSRAYHADGSVFVDTGATGYTYGDVRVLSGGPAVADLDKDGVPEVVAVYFQQHEVAIWHYDATKPGKFAFVRPTPVDINGILNPALCPANSNGGLHGGGPATVGDFNGDGVPDVALAGGVGYAVFDGKKLMDPSVPDAQTFLWAKQTQDCSSAGTGSSLFDFDGDGKAEVVYADERKLRVYEGATGKVLFETCNTSGTLSENPVIADVDGDGQADMIVVSNTFGAMFGDAYKCDDGTMTSGVRVFSSSDGSWVRTRRVWNQHSYHVTNVNEDGSIPTTEPANWLQSGLDNFRQNKQPGSEFAAPDGVIALLAPQCKGDFGLVATVRNVGEAVLPAGVIIGFYEGDPPNGTLLGYVTTKSALYPLQGEDVLFPLPDDTQIKSGSTKVYAILDDNSDPHPSWTECRTDNNQAAAVYASCGKL